MEDWDVSFLLDGPAVEIFERKLPDVPHVMGGDLDFVLCGSSAESDWEKIAVAIAKKTGVRCAVFLDHWKNYPQRFREMPDEIWVCDWYAEAIAHGAFPQVPIYLQENPYLEDFREEYARLPNADDDPHRVRRILWIDEPDRRKDLQAYLKYQVWDAEVLVRPHPSARFGRLRSDLADYAAVAGVEIVEDGETLAESVAWADTVVGADSMALVAALTVGKRVISVIPASEASIPHAGIERPLEEER